MLRDNIKIVWKIYDRHLHANVGQCRNDDEHKGLPLQSSSSHTFWQGGCTEPLLKKLDCLSGLNVSTPLVLGYTVLGH